ncbi:hypothetical protein Pcinc_003159 [Petrolisthes cinctipes]|uniref:Uncharacterized protein n=1 Tax=Petrolisthes cinctipes TaxID=88211 RepID=A0AAE1GHS1_PETCI|nr:hypothetical protein Pcinc_003159 [Petrolisthes cinctipes]
MTVRQNSLPSSSTPFVSRGSTSREEPPGTSEVVQLKHSCTSSEEETTASRCVCSVEGLSTHESAFQVAVSPPVRVGTALSDLMPQEGESHRAVC